MTMRGLLVAVGVATGTLGAASPGRHRDPGPVNAVLATIARVGQRR